MRLDAAVMNRSLMLVIGSILISSPLLAAAPPPPATVGYLATFKGLDESIARTDVSAFTHFNIAFANPGADGAFVTGNRLACMNDETGEPYSLSELRKTVRRLQAKGAKVLVSVAGGVIPGCSGDWKALLAPAQRERTVTNLLSLSDELGLDGIDVDIEWALLTDLDRAGDYVPFVAALSAAMKPRGLLLTCATASNPGGMIPAASIPYFDLVNVMSYDAIGPSWGEAGTEHSTYASAARDLDLWLGLGVRPERLVLGVPFYGYGFGGAKPNWSYREIVATEGGKAAESDLIGVACPGCRYITYNSPSTIERKARLAGQKAGGVMVWELSQDTVTHDLTRAIRAGLDAPRARDD